MWDGDLLSMINVLYIFETKKNEQEFGIICIFAGRFMIKYIEMDDEKIYMLHIVILSRKL